MKSTKTHLILKPEPFRYTTYLFDLDGTIINTSIYQKIYPKILNMLQKKKSLSLQTLHRQATLLNVHKNDNGNWDTGDLCKKLNCSSEYYKILNTHLKTNHILKKHITTTFKKIKQHPEHKIGIVSNSFHKTIQLYITKYNLTKYIDFIYASDDNQPPSRKDHLSYWKSLCKKHHLKPHLTLVIGNNPNDDSFVPECLGFHSYLLEKETDILKIVWKESKKEES